MHTSVVPSLLFAIVSMCFLYIESQRIAQFVFAASLIAFSWSILLSFIEIRLSTKAIEIELSDMEGLEDPSVMEYLKKKFERD